MFFSYYLCLMIEDLDPDPDPYLCLVDLDPDPGGPKTCGSGGSGSGTLVFSNHETVAEVRLHVQDVGVGLIAVLDELRIPQVVVLGDGAGAYIALR